MKGQDRRLSVSPDDGIARLVRDVAILPHVRTTTPISAPILQDQSLSEGLWIPLVSFSYNTHDQLHIVHDGYFR